MAFFKDLVAGLTKPFRSTGEAAIYAAKALYDPRSVEGYAPILTSEQEFSQYMNNPLKQASKDVAGLAAFGVPGGTGVAGGLKAGAAAGALGGYGASREGNELSDILFGTLTGGALGGAIGGVGSKLGGKSLGRASSKADDLYDDILKGDVTVAQSRSLDKVANRAKNYRQALQKTGVKISDAETTAYAAGEVAERLAAQKKAILSGSGYQMAGDDLLNALNKTKAFKDNPSLLQSDDLKVFFEQMNSRAVENGGYINAGDLWDVIRSIDDDLYDIAGTRVTPRTNDGNRAMKALRDALSKEIKGIDGVAEIDKTLKPIYDYLKYDAPYAIRRQSGTQPIVQAPGVPLSANLGTGKLVNKAKAVTANQLSKAGGVTLPNVPSRATSIAGLLAGNAGATPEEQPQDAQGLEAMMPEQFAQPQVDTQKEVADLTLQLFLETGDIKEAATLAELLVTSKYGSTQMGGGQELASGEFARKALTAQQAGYRALDTLNRNPSVTGKTQGIENFFNDLTGQANDATSYNQQIETFRTLFMSALGGASLMPAEIERFEKSLPKVTDSPERAKQKMEMLLPELDNLIYKNGAPDPTQEDLMQMLGY